DEAGDAEHGLVRRLGADAAAEKSVIETPRRVHPPGRLAVKIGEVAERDTGAQELSHGLPVFPPGAGPRFCARLAQMGIEAVAARPAWIAGKCVVVEEAQPVVDSVLSYWVDFHRTDRR